MKYFLLPVGLLLVSFFMQAQPLLKNDALAKPSGGNTYAIVIGVAKYLDPENTTKKT